MKPTPITDACYRRAGMMVLAQNDELDKTCRMLETLLGEARDVLKLAAALPTHQDCPVGNHGIVVAAMEAIARIDATFDPDNLEGPQKNDIDIRAKIKEIDAMRGVLADTPKTEQHREVADEMRVARENSSAEGMTADEFREQSES